MRHSSRSKAEQTSCGVPVAHKVFVTAPPGYGSVLDCPGDHQHGIPVTIDPDGTMRDLDGTRVGSGRRDRKQGHPMNTPATSPRTPPTSPLTDAMEVFDRFWNARHDGDWTVVGAGCECGTCPACAMSYVLSWTHALLSNPDLAAHAERLADGRKLS